MQSNLFKVRKKIGINKEYALCTLKWKKLKNMIKKQQKNTEKSKSKLVKKKKKLQIE